jgi:hypothetical protein
MFEGRRVLVVVPARGGSKGVKLKNLREVGGMPLVALAGHVASALPWVDRAIVSTDHEGIARVAEEAGLACPFMRPEDISGAIISDWQVLIHALTEMERIDAVRRASQGKCRPRVFVAEWIDPPFACGHWIPEMVEAAGGVVAGAAFLVEIGPLGGRERLAPHRVEVVLHY